MARLKINDQSVDLEEVNIEPGSDDAGTQIYLSLTLTCKKAAPFKPGSFYNLEVEGENEATGSKEIYPFKNYKLLSNNEKTLIFSHPDYSYNYELGIFIAPKSKVPK